MIAYFLKMVLQFTDDMRRQKLRCLLTMSGITWGTMSVVLLLAFGESLKDVSLKSMSGMGLNIVIMGGERTSKTFQGMPPGRYIRLREESVELLKKHVPEIGEISPEIEKGVNLSIGKERQRYQCIGVYPVYGTMRNLLPRPGGRFIDRIDIQERRRVVFIGSEVSKKFFGEKVDPVGKTLIVDGIPFTVIGVMKDKLQNNSYMTQDANLLFMPFPTCRDVFGITTINRVIFRARNAITTPALKDTIYKVMGKKYGFSPEDKDALWMWDTSEGTQFMHYFFLGFEGFLLCGGVFTLIVGGIGVANIMYVTIRERRREIGIKAALGATPALILAQFMLEAFVIMLVGGGVGVFGAWIIVKLCGSPALAGMQKYMGVPEIDLTISLITVSLLALIGFGAGFSPAKTASDMDPVRALEY